MPRALLSRPLLLLLSLQLTVLAVAAGPHKQEGN
jgi:hypothetical protein